MHTPELTASQVPLFCFTSLKTLLQEGANNALNEDGIPEWAVKRIWDYSENTKLQRIVDPNDFPIVHISVSNLIQDKKAQRAGRIKASLNLLVQTNRKNHDAALAWNIIQRINSLLMIYGPSSGIQMPRNIATEVDGVTGLLELHAFLQGLPISSWDSQRAFYNVEALMIQ